MNIDRIFFQTLKTTTSSLVAQDVDRTWDGTNDEGHPKKGELRGRKLAKEHDYEDQCQNRTDG